VLLRRANHLAGTVQSAKQRKIFSGGLPSVAPAASTFALASLVATVDKKSSTKIKPLEKA
jgi:hypothetical protein